MNNTIDLKLINKNNKIVQWQSIFSRGEINTLYAYIELGLKVKTSVNITIFTLIPLHYG